MSVCVSGVSLRSKHDSDMFLIIFMSFTHKFTSLSWRKTQTQTDQKKVVTLHKAICLTFAGMFD